MNLYAKIFIQEKYRTRWNYQQQAMLSGYTIQ